MRTLSVQLELLLFSFPPYRLTDLQIKVLIALRFIRTFTQKNLADQDRKEMQKIYAVNRIFAKVTTTLADLMYFSMIPDSRFMALEISEVYELKRS